MFRTRSARGLCDELAQVVGVALRECVGRESTNPDAHLAAGLLLTTWTVGLVQAHRTFDRIEIQRKRKRLFWLLLIREPSV